ncbi:alpha/beta hydrolase [Candidatus Poribacteria bacterium]|nr:alpha/beta hydrolase [Candidatus Poribacteria bacterium]
MGVETHELRFEATPEKGDVSAILMVPPEPAAVLVLGHGASTNMRHRTLQSIADSCAAVGIATLRYNMPYMERGGGRESEAVALATVRQAAKTARERCAALPLIVGGHSYCGRMSSLAAAESPIEGVRGLVFFSFPLHPAGSPSTARAEHLPKITVPMLFLSGTRDDLAKLDLLEPVCAGLGDRATLHLLQTADHGFKVQKRGRSTDEDVFDEMARVLKGWLDRIG